MLNKKDSLKAIRSFFKKNKVGKLADLFVLLDTTSRMSVFRRLRELHYLSSYSHAGRYYTLPDIVDFSPMGLWFCGEVRFSQFGNLKETLFQLIEESDSGKMHIELEKQLHVRVHNTLLDLVQINQIARKKTSGGFIYISINKRRAKQQLTHREKYLKGWSEDNIPDWIIVEILVSVIKTSKGIHINLDMVTFELTSKGISITRDQIGNVLDQLDLKKTLDIP